MLGSGQVQQIHACPIEEPPTQQPNAVRSLTTSRQGVCHAPYSRTVLDLFLETVRTPYPLIAIDRWAMVTVSIVSPCPKECSHKKSQNQRHPQFRFFRILHRFQYRGISVRDVIFSKWLVSAKSTRMSIILTSAKELQAQQNCCQIWSHNFHK